MKLAPPTCKQVKKALKRLGFQPKKTNRGSHDKFEHREFRGKRRVVTVDCPKAPFDHFLIGTMAAQAGMSKREFWRLCVGALPANKVKS